LKTITFLNQKGGVGKTSCTHHLGGALALAGRRVLLVDTDPQASLTQGLFGPEALETIAPKHTVAAVLSGQDPFPASVVRPTGIAGIDLMPGSRESRLTNKRDLWAEDRREQLRLAGLLAELADRYDYCLIDCPPTLEGCAWAALAASDALVVPVQPEDYGSQGVFTVRGFFTDAQAKINPRLRLAGYLISMCAPRRAVHKLYSETLRQQFGSDVFETVIPEAADFAEAITHRVPIGVYKPKGASAKIIRALADELLLRLDRVIGEEAA
jgi:chromosome partitioning protein